MPRFRREGAMADGCASASQSSQRRTLTFTLARSKRIGGSLTKDNVDEDPDDNGPITNEIKVASQEVIAQRRIVKPRRRGQADVL